MLLLFLTSVSAQTTPGDEDSFCVSRLGGANNIKGVKVLLDSRHYQQLLGVGGAVWDQIDLDDNNPPGFVNPTHVSHTLIYLGWYIISLIMLPFTLSGNTVLVVDVNGLLSHVVTLLDLRKTGSSLNSLTKWLLQTHITTLVYLLNLYTHSPTVEDDLVALQ